MTGQEITAERLRGICKWCRYYAVESFYVGESHGECHRHAPFMQDRMSKFPPVGENCWCGDYESGSEYDEEGNER